MKTDINKLREKQAAEVAKAEAFNIVISDVLDNWPERLPAPEKIHPHVCYGTAAAEISADTLEEGLTLAEVAGPVALCRVKDTFLSFKPQSTVDYDKTPEAEKKGDKGALLIAPWILKADPLAGYPTKYSLEFWIMAGAQLVRVTCKLPDHLADVALSYQKERRNRHGHVTQARVCELRDDSGHFQFSDRYYASEDQPNHFIRWAY